MDSSLTFSSATGPAIDLSHRSVARPIPWEMAALVVLCAGIAGRLAWLTVGVYRLRTYLDRATLYSCPLVRRMEVHAYVGISDDVTSPVTFGVRRPGILVPARFDEIDT